MLTSRRQFLRNAAASAALASLSRPSCSARPAAELQQQLSEDPLRPQFHLLPAKNWMNDPNGPIYWNGNYHMFFQYNPGAAVWGDMHWAHAVSPDMIHWRHLPVALAPTPGWDDADGCFTGSAVDDHGTATILYTGVKKVLKDRATLRDGHNNFREVQCLATSSDPQLRSWIKSPLPVIAPPKDSTLAGFRDPFVWRQGHHWLLGVASGHFQRGGCVLLYRSRDLRNWEYLHELFSGPWTEKQSINPVDSGEMWECPDFFPLGKKHVLLYSTAGSVLWESGELNARDFRFHSERRGILDHGAYYAQKTQLDAHGNRILWGWIPEKRPDSELIAAGWAGCMALPRLLTLSPDGELLMAFASGTKSLREKALPPPQKADRPDTPMPPSFSIESACAELTWQTVAEDFTVTLEDRHGPWWSASLTRGAGSSSALTVNATSFEIPGTSGGSPRAFHLLLDASVAELIVDNRHAITTRIYRRPEGPLRIQPNDKTKIVSFEAWPLRPISPNRLTT